MVWHTGFIKLVASANTLISCKTSQVLFSTSSVVMELIPDKNFVTSNFIQTLPNFCETKQLLDKRDTKETFCSKAIIIALDVVYPSSVNVIEYLSRTYLTIAAKAENNICDTTCIVSAGKQMPM